MGGAKGIVHIDIAELGHLLRQLRNILFLALVDAAVFQQHDLAGLHLDAVDPVGNQWHITAQQFGHASGHGSE
ncbi:hypothetical protein D3C72_1427100 [compost metagenome]